jgi:hypothetical protein
MWLIAEGLGQTKCFMHTEMLTLPVAFVCARPRARHVTNSLCWHLRGC